jgi:hypothetical protein
MRGDAMQNEILSAFKFNPLGDDAKPSDGCEVLLFLHDKWRGYDEIISASFCGDEYFFNGRKVPKQFIAGWLELPIKIAYDSSESFLP